MVERVVVTGIGIASVCGFDKTSFWNGLLTGESTITDIFKEEFDKPYKLGMLDPDKKNAFLKENLSDSEREKMLPCAEIAAAAAKAAVKDSGLDALNSGVGRFEVGVSVGTTNGELAVLEKRMRENSELNANDIIKYYSHLDIAVHTAQAVGAGGSVSLHADACSSSNIAAAHAYELIRHGRATRMIVGGADVFAPMIVCGFAAMRALSDTFPTPFDVNRKGIVLSEGASMLVLESLSSAIARKAHIYGEVLGYGISNDACHMASMDTTGLGIAAALEKAIIKSGIDKSKVDYFCAHGTGTQVNDSCESKALCSVFGEHITDIPVSSIKGALGHSLGAAAGFGLIASLLAMEHNVIPPTAHLVEQDSSFPIKVLNKPEHLAANIIMNNSSAFGGANCCVVLGRLGENEI